VAGTRLVEAAGVHLFLPGPQFAFDLVVIKRLTGLDVGQFGHCALDVGVALREAPVCNRQATPGLNLEDQGGPIRIVCLDESRGDARIRVAAPPVFHSQRFDDLRGASRTR